MVERSFEGGRWTAVFRPGGIGRIFRAGFLVFWLCGWLLGEVAVGAIVLAALGVPVAAEILRRLRFPELSGADWTVLAFLGFWLLLWTVGGLTAAWELMRLLSSVDRIEWDGEAVELFRRVGPFRSRRKWRKGKIEHVSLARPARALTLHTGRASHRLTRWGSKAERAAVRDEMRRALGIAPRGGERARSQESPAGWASAPDPDGGVLLTRDPAARRRQAALAWTVTVALAAGAVIVLGRGYLEGPWGRREAMGAVAAVLGVALLAAGSLWLSHGRTELVVRPREIELRRRFLSRTSSRTVRPLKLRVEHSTDSDGDDWFELQALAGDERRTIERRMNESGAVLDLARWIAEKSGAPLDIGRGVEGEEREAG
ncbi:MAG TPA: hypothetical protein VGK89_08980 [Candidatus Eisenbacteria bacterium]|jgi:hypothetical protein